MNLTPTSKSFAEGIPDYPMDIWLRYQAQSLLTKNGRAASFPPREVADRVFSHHSVVSRRPLRGATRPPQQPWYSWASRVCESVLGGISVAAKSIQEKYRER